MKRDFLLEIGCENLPSGYLDAALRQLRKIFSDRLAEERIGFEALNVLGTPNRLVIHIRSIEGKQADLEEVVTGPPISVAVSDEGEYTKAALGFAKAQGASEKDLKKVKKKKGEYLAVVKNVPGDLSSKVLLKGIPAWISAIRFPRVMRWDDGGLLFARPIRWVLSFMGSKPFRFTLGKLKSSNRTRIDPEFDIYTEVGSVEEYFGLMKNEGIILDPSERRKRIRRMLKRGAEKVGGKAVKDEELVGIVGNLLESPVALEGGFDKRFLKLPREVVVTALKSHQKYFSVESGSRKLMPFFISFADGVRRNKKEIARGNERVLQARLADAEFYYREDTSKPISTMAEKLKDIVWMEGMGSLADKAARIGELAEWIRSEMKEGSGELKKTLSRAAELAKADIASEMVKDGKEFTLLQGYIGREYAKASGEREEVANAIYEHYMPRSAEDSIPTGRAGLILSFADKLDNISGGFLLDLQPSGSQDPYALRRQAMSILRIMLSGGLKVSLKRAIEKSLSLFGDKTMPSDKENVKELLGEIVNFFEQRFTGILRSEGFDYDIINAVLSSEWDVPLTSAGMVRQLSEMRREGKLQELVTAMKRISNIIPAEAKGKIQAAPDDLLASFASGGERKLAFETALFEEGSERKLFLKAVSVSKKMLGLREKGAEEKIPLLLSRELVKPVNAYFEDVLVNCEDPGIRENRILFISSLHLVFSRFCDFSQITEE